jgi:hypothetical protein
MPRDDLPELSLAAVRAQEAGRGHFAAVSKTGGGQVLAPVLADGALVNGRLAG